MPGKKKPGPSVKDDKVYEAVRDQGGSKEKAARIANASAARGRSRLARRVARPARTTTGRSKTRKRAKELGLSGYSGKTKSELVVVRNHWCRRVASGLRQRVAR